MPTYYKILILAGIALAFCTSAWAEEQKPVNWIDVTQKVDGGSGKSEGWESDASAKVFRDEPGEQLKITSKAGTFRVALATKKLFEVTEKGEKEVAGAQILKRNELMIVIKSDQVKFRITLKEEVAGVKKYLGGLTRME